MTEQEWLACTAPEPMLAFLRKEASERKLRLLACACCRRVWDLVRLDAASRH
jgi:formate dehydrogenase maturation protein FdhE